MIASHSLLLVVFLVFAHTVRSDEEVTEEVNSNFQPPRQFSPEPHLERYPYYPDKRCVDDGNWCFHSSNCCSRRCGWDFHCKPLGFPIDICIPDYGQCIDSQQCCSGICYAGSVCAPYSYSQYPSVPSEIIIGSGFRGGPQPGGGMGLQPGGGLGMQPGGGMGLQPGGGFGLGRGMGPHPGGFAEPFRG